MLKRALCMAAAAALVAGCASSHVLVGQKRPPIPVEQVQVYLEPPANYERVALLESTSQGSFAVTRQQRTNKALDRMRAEAAKLGANGVLIQGIDTQAGGAVAYSDPGTGITTAGAGLHRTGTGIAIYVHDE